MYKAQLTYFEILDVLVCCLIANQFMLPWWMMDFLPFADLYLPLLLVFTISFCPELRL